MILHLIRHAQAYGNENRCFLGSTDHPLTQAGEGVCRAAAAPDVQVVFVSPLRRCLQTSALLYPELRPIVIQELREYHFGIFEGKNHIQLQNDPVYLSWLASNGRQAPPEGESWEMFCKRCKSALEKMVADCAENQWSKAAAITHGGVMMAMLAAVAIPPREPYRWQSENLGGWTVTVQQAVWQKNKTVTVNPLAKGAQHV